jgi:hypothetical protein
MQTHADVAYLHTYNLTYTASFVNILMRLFVVVNGCLYPKLYSYDPRALNAVFFYADAC